MNSDAFKVAGAYALIVSGIVLWALFLWWLYTVSSIAATVTIFLLLQVVIIFAYTWLLSTIRITERSG